MNTVEWKWAMAEAVDATGEGANGGGESAAGAPSEGAASAGAPSEAGKESAAGGEAKASAATGDDLKPYGLGTKPEESAAEKGTDAGEKKGGEAAEKDEKKDVTEADYEKAFVKDEELLGNDEEIVLDKDLAKAVMPTAKELGVSPEAFAKLANALAKAQLDSKNDLTRSRVEYFKEMKQAAMKKYTPKDFERIEAGLKANAKAGGQLDYLLRNSELGADPEMLAILHKLGGMAQEDHATGAASGGGRGGYDPNSISGLASQWK